MFLCVCVFVCVLPFQVLNPITDFYETQYVLCIVTHPNATHLNCVLSVTTWWKQSLLSGPSRIYPYGNRKNVKFVHDSPLFRPPTIHKNLHIRSRTEKSTSQPVKKIERLYHKQLIQYHKSGKFRLQKQTRAKACKTKKKTLTKGREKPFNKNRRAHIRLLG